MSEKLSLVFWLVRKVVVFMFTGVLLATGKTSAGFPGNSCDSGSQHSMRVSYNGYYLSLPSWWCGFDSRYPLQHLKQALLYCGTGVFFITWEQVVLKKHSVLWLWFEARLASVLIFFTTAEWCIAGGDFVFPGRVGDASFWCCKNTVEAFLSARVV